MTTFRQKISMHFIVPHLKIYPWINVIYYILLTIIDGLSEWHSEIIPYCSENTACAHNNTIVAFLRLVRVLFTMMLRLYWILWTWTVLCYETFLILCLDIHILYRGMDKKVILSSVCNIVFTPCRFLIELNKCNVMSSPALYKEWRDMLSD